ncbi:hypothetical protein BGZ70_000590, partial [Mortierella alpina]
RDRAELVSICDFETGRMTSFHWKRGYQCDYHDTIAFSDDGSKLAIGVQDIITTYCAENGTLLGSFRVPEYCGEISGIAFIQDDTHMLVCAAVSADGYDDDISKHGHGFIVDVANWTIVNRFAVTNSGNIGRSPEPGHEDITFNGNLFRAFEMSLDLIHLNDRVLHPYSQPMPLCDTQCKNKLTPLSKQPETIVTPSGMKFTVETSPSGIVVSASDAAKSLDDSSWLSMDYLEYL